MMACKDGLDRLREDAGDPVPYARQPIAGGLTGVHVCIRISE